MQYFSISKNHLSFIVRAGTVEELNRRLDEIERKYPEFAKTYLRPGYYIVQAESIKDAKLKIKSQEQDHKVIYGPLFRPPGEAKGTALSAHH